MSQGPKKAILKNSATPQAVEGGPMEGILAQWRRERPDIDPAPMAVCGEVWRAGEKLRQGVLGNISNYNLDFAGMDVLLTLRRQGEGETLSPSLLAKDMMLSTSAMTNRLDRLEKRGLVERKMDPNDRRGQMVALTREGFELANEVVVTHVETEEKMLSNLSNEERQHLRFLLEKIT
ncbi:MarR family winged helix-turn-helix transcriptional regulator [Kiloniella sp. EL199]|uniref:MarR family winged helix-turn-helix transcriptional regulator n=1 Tax=Kiloniella sp. EL199 TaxID=2107581 RepID=UPI000EA40451|nr:MarR family transcriptional regulator [Kiloniella sp. EL199]